MKRLLVSVATVALLSSGALAADLVIDTTMTMPAPVADNWTGFYAGLHLGYADADMDYGTDPDDGWLPEGVFLGGQAGYNWQMGQFVLGLEGDVSWGGMVESEYFDGGVSGGDDYYVASIDWFSTLRARAGYDIDGIMPYLTAGLAAASVHIDQPGDEVDGTHFGWAVGAGIEAKIDDNWSIKGEYIYAALGEDDYYDTPTDLTMHSVRVGLNFAF